MRPSMLLVEHENEIKWTKPPHAVMRVLAFIGRLLRYKCPRGFRQNFQLA
jgi:hypothetical protein